MKLDMEINKENSAVESKAPSKTAQKSFGRFIITSGLFHIMAASAIIITNHVPATETETEKDLVVIDFAAPVEANSAPEYASAPEQVATVASTQAPAVETEPAAAEPVTVEAAKPIQAAAPVLAPVTKPTAAPSPIVQEAPKPIPVVAQKVAAPQVDPQEVDQNLNQVDAQNDQEVQNESAKIKEEADKAEKALAESAKLAEQKLKLPPAA